MVLKRPSLLSSFTQIGWDWYRKEENRTYRAESALSFAYENTFLGLEVAEILGLRHFSWNKPLIWINYANNKMYY